MNLKCSDIVCRLALLVAFTIGGAGHAVAADKFSVAADTVSPAVDNGREISIDLQVYYRQNVIVLEPGYKDNELRLSDFVRKINQAIADSSYRVQDIVIRSAASPEGPYDHNVWLSENRGQALKRALQARLSIPDSCFVMDAVGEDWEGLYNMVRLYEVPHKQDVLDIIDHYFTDTTSQPRRSLLCKLKIGKLDRGKVWNYLYGNIFPYLRNASNSVVCHLVPVTRVTIVTEQGVPAGKDTLYIMSPSGTGAAMASAADAPQSPDSTRVKKKNRYRFALKTNLLSDAALCPNVEVEFPLGRRFSLMAEHTFPWYTFDSDRYACQILMSGAELRLWFGDRRKHNVLTGWFTGLYGSYGYGDLEWKGKGYQCRGMWHAGLSFGYSFPLGKRDNWHLETSLAVGYAPVSYDYYERSDYYGLLIYKNSGEKLWIGPTKLKCSLVWMIPGNKKTADAVRTETRGKAAKTESKAAKAESKAAKAKAKKK